MKIKETPMTQILERSTLFFPFCNITKQLNKTLISIKRIVASNDLTENISFIHTDERP